MIFWDLIACYLRIAILRNKKEDRKVFFLVSLFSANCCTYVCWFVKKHSSLVVASIKLELELTWVLLIWCMEAKWNCSSLFILILAEVPSLLCTYCLACCKRITIALIMLCYVHSDLSILYLFGGVLMQRLAESSIILLM
jgi:hypothetical protein